MSIESTLSRVVTAIRSAPEGTDTSLLQEFCSNHKVSKAEVASMIDRGCTDEGAVRSALGQLKHVARKKPNAPRKKPNASRKKASGKKGG